MKRDAIDLSTLNVFTLFRKYFVRTLLGMLSMSAVWLVPGVLWSLLSNCREAKASLLG